MDVHSGRFGVVNGQTTVYNWSIGEISTPSPHKGSGTRGGTARVAGLRDWSGSFAQYGGIPLLMPGDYFNFGGFTAADDDTETGDGEVYTGPAIVDQLTVNWDWTTGVIVNQEIAFSANGVLSLSTANYIDTTVPDVHAALPPLGIFLGEGGGSVDQSQSGSGDNEICAASAALAFVAANQPYANSCTSGWTYRKAGPIDWTGNIVAHSNKRNEGFNIGDDLELSMYVNSNDFWHLKWAHVKDFSGLNVDRESGAIIQQTIGLEMNGVLSGSLGEITLPGADDAWWPVPGA